MLSMRTSGFTLVELAIVLVIIGLVVGGILVGRELLYQAEISSIIRSMQRTSVPIYTFEEKYGQLPGDFTSATRFWGEGTSCPSAAGTGTCNGNGDKLIAYGATTGSEMTYLWQHLGLAGMIEGKYEPNWPADSLIGERYTPRLPVRQWGKLAFHWSGTNADWYTSTNSQLSNRLVIFAGDVASGTLAHTQSMAQSIPCADAKAIEEKIDDLMPGQGRVHAERLGDCPTSATASDGAVARYRNPPQYPTGTNPRTVLGYRVE